jgi:hypothetical protein
MDGTIFQQFIDLLKTVSPVIWQAFIKQAYSEAISYLVWALITGVGFFFLVKLFLFSTREYKKDKYSDWDIGKWCALAGSIIAGFISVSTLITAIQWFANPEFYAIRFLLEKFTGN